MSMLKHACAMQYMATELNAQKNVLPYKCGDEPFEKRAKYERTCVGKQRKSTSG
jgi:hypothetical protein